MTLAADLPKREPDQEWLLIGPLLDFQVDVTAAYRPRASPNGWPEAARDIIPARLTRPGLLMSARPGRAFQPDPQVLSTTCNRQPSSSGNGQTLQVKNKGTANTKAHSLLKAPEGGRRS
jgi:hypothetical protein